MRIQYKLARVLIVSLMMVSGAYAQIQTGSNFAADNSKITGIISKMTLDQKAQLVIGTGMFFDLPIFDIPVITFLTCFYAENAASFLPKSLRVVLIYHLTF